MAESKPIVDIGKEKLPEMLPILPLFDAVLFPKMVLPLVVMQEESIKLVDEAMTKNRVIGLLVSKKTPPKAPARAKGFVAAICSATGDIPSGV